MFARIFLIQVPVIKRHGVIKPHCFSGGREGLDQLLRNSSGRLIYLKNQRHSYIYIYVYLYIYSYVYLLDCNRYTVAVLPWAVAVTADSWYLYTLPSILIPFDSRGIVNQHFLLYPFSDFWLRHGCDPLPRRGLLSSVIAWQTARQPRLTPPVVFPFSHMQ